MVKLPPQSLGLLCSLQPCPLPSAPAKRIRGRSLPSRPKTGTPRVSVRRWSDSRATARQRAGRHNINAVAPSSVGQKTQHGHHLSHPGARRAAQHSVEHRCGDFQLWKRAGKEPEEPHSQDRGLQWGWACVFLPHHLIQRMKLNDLFVPNPVHILYGGKHGTHGVPDTVREDSCQHLLRAPPPSQLVHVQSERSRNHFQPFGNCWSSQVKIRNEIWHLILALSPCTSSVFQSL